MGFPKRRGCSGLGTAKGMRAFTVLGGRYTMLAPIPHNDCVVDGIGEDGNPSCKKWGWYWDGPPSYAPHYGQQIHAWEPDTPLSPARTITTTPTCRSRLAPGSPSPCESLHQFALWFLPPPWRRFCNLVTVGGIVCPSCILSMPVVLILKPPPLT